MGGLTKVIIVGSNWQRGTTTCFFATRKLRDGLPDPSDQRFTRPKSLPRDAPGCGNSMRFRIAGNEAGESDSLSQVGAAGCPVPDSLWACFVLYSPEPLRADNSGQMKSSQLSVGASAGKSFIGRLRRARLRLLVTLFHAAKLSAFLNLFGESIAGGCHEGLPVLVDGVVCVGMFRGLV